MQWIVWLKPKLISLLIFNMLEHHLGDYYGYCFSLSLFFFFKRKLVSGCWRRNIFPLHS